MCGLKQNYSSCFYHSPATFTWQHTNVHMILYNANVNYFFAQTHYLSCIQQGISGIGRFISGVIHICILVTFASKHKQRLPSYARHFDYRVYLYNILCDRQQFAVGLCITTNKTHVYPWLCMNNIKLALHLYTWITYAFCTMIWLHVELPIITCIECDSLSVPWYLLTRWYVRHKNYD